MTTPSDGPVPEDHENEPFGAASPQPDGAAGVELGLSEGPGGTFEPEEDVSPES
jgi:hypothetical protein